MPQPTGSDVHIDQPLTNISIAYIQRAENYVATKIFPTVRVQKKTDKYFTFDKNDFLRDEAKLRAPATESEGSGYGVSNASYSCDVYAFHKDVDDQTAANTDAPLDPEGDAARFVAQRMLTRLERKFMTDFFATSIWATDATPGTLWNDALSDPIGDMDTAKEAILGVTGYDPNTLLLGYQVFRQLKNHPDIVDRIKYTTSDVVTEALLAKYFGVDRVLVSRAVYASNNEGETAAYAFAGGKHALLAYVAPSPSLLTPSAGYTFIWDNVSDGQNNVIGTVRIPIPEKRVVRVESQMAFDNKPVSTDLGYFFNGAVA